MALPKPRFLVPDPLLFFLSDFKITSRLLPDPLEYPDLHPPGYQYHKAFLQLFQNPSREFRLDHLSTKLNSIPIGKNRFFLNVNKQLTLFTFTKKSKQTTDPYFHDSHSWTSCGFNKRFQLIWICHCYCTKTFRHFFNQVYSCFTTWNVNK